MKTITARITFEDKDDTWVHARLADISNRVVDLRLCPAVIISPDPETPSNANFGAVDDGKDLQGWGIEEMH